MVYGVVGRADTHGMIHHYRRISGVHLAGLVKRTYLIARPCMTTRMSQEFE